MPIKSPPILLKIHSIQKRGINTLVVSGGEIDICVLTTVLSAVDFDCRVIVASPYRDDPATVKYNMQSKHQVQTNVRCVRR
jgi:nicotinamidase-related amidase